MIKSVSKPQSPILHIYYISYNFVWKQYHVFIPSQPVCSCHVEAYLSVLSVFFYISSYVRSTVTKTFICFLFSNVIMVFDFPHLHELNVLHFFLFAIHIICWSKKGQRIMNKYIHYTYKFINFCFLICLTAICS